MVLNCVSGRVSPGTLLHSFSLEFVRVRGTTLVLRLQQVLVRPGDKGIVEAPRPSPGESFNAFYLLVTVVIHYHHCGEL